MEWFIFVRFAILVFNYLRIFLLDFFFIYLILLVFFGIYYVVNMYFIGLIYLLFCKVFNDNMLIVVGFNFVKFYICLVEIDICVYISIVIF